ncbi:MAG: hypothetical protein NTZ08_10325 [Verrucomicrobia bacterium]|nr:hypothetical protein [Verrucomicrobiota bacterium]
MSETHSTKRQCKKNGHLATTHRQIESDADRMAARHGILPLSL